ncbi:hypothetical protein BSIN_1287 [Burkholderia singularis]|uniref:Uncharacterized protein n=1 Tax=Burkholderia singularis TaxID=1503053 RepID=A0A238GYI1_9BURK|nr:hypothetical protein BSIN_1287 [Burkholderia singularis]
MMRKADLTVRFFYIDRSQAANADSTPSAGRQPVTSGAQPRNARSRG